MKAIIVEDSRLARNELKRLLEKFPTLEIVAEAQDSEEAKQLIESLCPDLIFLDIQLPGKSGFELLEELDYVPEVVFTTAYSEYALKAFDYNALDYLLKPIQPERLTAALEKVEQKLAIRETTDTTKEQLTEADQIFVKDNEQCWFVKLGEISLLEVNGNYTKIYFQNHSPMVMKSLNYLESRLDPKVFFRANRQEIINLKRVEKIIPWFSGTLKVQLDNGREVEISRRQSAVFKEQLSL
ncbi:LytR/AlgR family response regulator transcription factor [Williamwhitmania taraxaci]|uniref:Two component transcriptional regulator, LytTR family n=1 Tax=Williamwhitmania taraxaci TaxID=1640674 RepID=A0A1G6KII2_9BACT|nr:LytTR family DNA-binding domain-containing protein [Williamwhitmania taraxaci]SDC30912.1 two component transcriptional regulator, LytTR family [Williamwhitmania taraxaci]